MQHFFQEEFHVLPTYPTLAVNESLEVFPTYVDSNGVIYVQPKEWEDMVIHLDLELQRVYSTVSATVVLTTILDHLMHVDGLLGY